MSDRFRSVLIALVSLGLASCAALFGETEADKKPAATRTLSYKLPKLANPDPTGQPEEREIDGIVISLVPTPFSPQRTTQTTLKELSTMFVMNDQYTYEKTELPGVRITPPTLSLHAKITNRLDHVLRFGGAVFVAKVNGQRLSTVQGMDDLLSAVLAPGDAHDVELVLAKEGDIADGATVALDLFDVPTMTDAAGNATKKAAFRWVFKFMREPMEEQVRVTTSQVKMTRAEAAQYMER